MKKQKANIFLVLLIFTLISVFTVTVFPNFAANANAGPPTWGETGRGIIFRKHDKVKIVGEVLDITFGENNIAEVRAEYTMANISDESVSVLTMFLLPQSIDESKQVKVMQNNTELSYELRDYEIGANQTWEAWEAILAEEEPEFTQFERVNSIGAIIYTLDFAPQEQLKVVVEYNYDLEIAFYKETQTFRYYLSPAKYWQDFGGIEINVHLNESYPRLSKAYQNNQIIKFKKIKRTHYQYTYDSLPDGQLSIVAGYPLLESLYANRGTIYLSLFYLLPFILAAIIIVIITVLLIKRKIKKKRASR